MQIHLSTRGEAKYVRCDKQHGGSTVLDEAGRKGHAASVYQCRGCGAQFSTAEVLAMIESQGRETP